MKQKFEVSKKSQFQPNHLFYLKLINQTNLCLQFPDEGAIAIVTFSDRRQRGPAGNQLFLGKSILFILLLGFPQYENALALVAGDLQENFLGNFVKHVVTWKKKY